MDHLFYKKLSYKVALMEGMDIDNGHIHMSTNDCLQKPID
jgi:hypothetical protein